VRPYVIRVLAAVYWVFRSSDQRAANRAVGLRGRSQIGENPERITRTSQVPGRHLVVTAVGLHPMPHGGCCLSDTPDLPTTVNGLATVPTPSAIYGETHEPPKCLAGQLMALHETLSSGLSNLLGVRISLLRALHLT
jgi:hypothetical protein